MLLFIKFIFLLRSYIVCCWVSVMPLCFNALWLATSITVRCLVSQFYFYLSCCFFTNVWCRKATAQTLPFCQAETLKWDPLEQILRLTSDNFPLELLQGLQAEQLIIILDGNLYIEFKKCSLPIEIPGMKGTPHDKRKVWWNPKLGTTRIEYLDFNFFASAFKFLTLWF